MAHDAHVDRLQEVAGILETDPGTYIGDGTLLAAAQAQHLIEDPLLRWDINVVRRNIKRSTYTPLQPLAGLKRGKLTFSTEMTGRNPANGAPDWAIFLRAAGFAQETCYAVAIGAVSSGPVAGGTVLAVTDSGDTLKHYIRVVNELRNGAGHLLFERLASAGTIVSTDKIKSEDLVTTYATAAAAGQATIGLVWYPVSFETFEANLENFGTGDDFAVGDIITSVARSDFIGMVMEDTNDDPATNDRVRLNYRWLAGDQLQSGDDIVSGVKTADLAEAPSVHWQPTLSTALLSDGLREIMKGARGSCSFGGNVGERCMMGWDFDGAFQDVADGGNLFPTTFALQVPPTLLSTSLSIGDDDNYPLDSAMFTPKVKGFQLAMNNEVAFRTDSNESSGIVEARIGNRAPTMTLTLEQVLDQQFDYVQKLIDVGKLRAEFQVGSSNGNLFRIYVPGAIVTGADSGEDGGVRTRTVQCDLTSGSQTAGQGDNELYIVYQTASLPS